MRATTPVPDSERRALGRRWSLGIASVFFGALAGSAVLCLHFPELLTTAELRALYPMHWVRALVSAGIVLAAALGAAAIGFGRGRRLGALGMLLAFSAQLAGGAWVEVETPIAERHSFGLELLALATVVPAALLFRWAAWPALQTAISTQPLFVQLPLAVLAADLASYAAHRAFHSVPWLWRFHAIHHSSEALDWLAGSRLHLVDVVVTRAVAFVPLFVLGFSPEALAAYLVWVATQATWIHANLGTGTRWLEGWLVTPRYHHWHHAADAVAMDKNFAVHFPWVDRLFGTHYLPEEAWPERYGVLSDEPPAGFPAQLVWPFTRD
jgi:lathosterol oxidase